MKYHGVQWLKITCIQTQIDVIAAYKRNISSKTLHYPYQIQYNTDNIHVWQTISRTNGLQ